MSVEVRRGTHGALGDIWIAMNIENPNIPRWVPGACSTCSKDASINTLMATDRGHDDALEVEISGLRSEGSGCSKCQAFISGHKDGMTQKYVSKRWLRHIPGTRGDSAYFPTCR